MKNENTPFIEMMLQFTTEKKANVAYGDEFWFVLKKKVHYLKNHLIGNG